MLGPAVCELTALLLVVVARRLTLITFLSTSPDGVFYSGLGMAQIEYMPPCCSFEHNTAPENVLELLLLCCGSMVILVAVRYSLQVRGNSQPTPRGGAAMCSR